jgi:hypothetical protein
MTRTGSRSRQVIEGHWEGLAPQRKRRQAVASLELVQATAQRQSRPERSSELARSLAVDTEPVGEMAA